jgi:biotin-(acetyl-CoA carboxylase) ligase
VFKKATKIISGTMYPTMNLYFHHMWKIKMVLEEELETVELELETIEKETIEKGLSSEVVVTYQAKSRFLKEMIKLLKRDEEEIQRILEQVTHNTMCSCGF